MRHTRQQPASLYTTGGQRKYLTANERSRPSRGRPGLPQPQTWHALPYARLHGLPRPFARTRDHPAIGRIAAHFLKEKRMAGRCATILIVHRNQAPQGRLALGNQAADRAEPRPRRLAVTMAFSPLGSSTTTDPGQSSRFGTMMVVPLPPRVPPTTRT